MKICIIGGGINGLCCAWILAKQGHNIHLYERNKLVSQTSRSSSKLLHGGLRYLEQGNIKLVREALKERDAWLKRAPSLTKPIRLVLPIYKSSRRNRWMIKTGLFLYDNLARSSILPKSKWLNAKSLTLKDPSLNPKGLVGGYEFSDGQMDDYQLGLWVAEQAKNLGCQLLENTAVKSVDQQGNVYLETQSNKKLQFDRVINVAGPWAEQLIRNSNLSSPYKLDAVRGSHLVINKECKQAYLFEIPKEKRIFFVLPWKGNTLIGTTEIKQTLEDPIECSKQEQDYLLVSYNQYHNDKISNNNIIETISGVRPLLSSSKNPNDTSREYAIHRDNKLITIYGGKWTTALSLATKVAQQAQ